MIASWSFRLILVAIALWSVADAFRLQRRDPARPALPPWTEVLVLYLVATQTIYTSGVNVFSIAVILIFLAAAAVRLTRSRTVAP